MRRGRQAWERVDAALPHGRRVIPYKGFELVYSRRSSLVERIREQGDYEPTVAALLAEALRPSGEPTLVDVGANIGLISLAVLGAVPTARIFAFEPGPRQHDLFAATVARNALEHRIFLSPLALADEAGSRDFAVHPSRHSAADGFLDTRRAGRAGSITVTTETLDRWWERAGQPHVDAIKIDTEGSELLVLRGGAELIARCRPVLAVEIHVENLSPYSWGPEDVRGHLEALGYELEWLTRADVIARPR